MQKGIFTLSVFITLLCSAGSALAQPSVAAIEQQLAWHLKHIQYWKFEFSPDDTTFSTNVNAEDSIAGASKMLLNYLMDVGNKQPALLRSDIKLPEGAELKIVTSEDKKLRFYSWDTHMGGSVHFIDIVAQYETATGGTQAIAINDISKYSGDGPDPGVTYTGIQTMSSSRKKYYLPTYTGSTATDLAIKGVQAYNIEGDKLVDAPIFHGPRGPVSKVEYQYDHAANFDMKKMKEAHTMRLDKQKLYVPEAADNKLTGNYMVYVYDGEKFVYDKNAK